MILIKCLIIFVIVLCSYNGVVGDKRRSISSMQMEEENALEMERQLKILNKTPIKTFQIEGQIIDCVDVYKQPAFDHPLLKNHKIQLRPSHINSFPEQSSSGKTHQSVIQKVDCPKGTVPIRRTYKEDLIRAKALTESYRSPVVAANTSAYHENVVSVPGQHIAVVSTQAPTLLYNGIAGTLNSLNPSVKTGQTSSSQLWIESASSKKYNTLRVGWMVSPLLFNDTKTHTFGYWEADGISRGGCYNYLCSQFVQIDQNIFLGAHVHEISEYGGSTLVVIDFAINKDAKTGNWWLSATKNGETLTHIGYWPKELVPSLSEGTLTYSWGGAATVTKNGVGPEMGNGHFPAGKDRFNLGGFIVKMRLYNRLQIWEEPRFLGLKPYADKGRCYNVDYYGYVNQDFEYAFQFGGPGGFFCG